MDGRFVVARAAGGEPLKRVAVEARGVTVYLANPDLLDRIETGESVAVGFLLEDVYTFDSIVFSEMVALWDEGMRKLPWNRLKGFSPHSDSR
jgi:hypothetical protein